MVSRYIQVHKVKYSMASLDGLEMVEVTLKIKEIYQTTVLVFGFQIKIWNLMMVIIIIIQRIFLFKTKD